MFRKTGHVFPIILVLALTSFTFTKTVFLSILAIVLYSSILNAQSNVYHPFPDSNAAWKESQDGGSCFSCSIDQLYLTGDTVVVEKNYKKIQHHADTYRIEDHYYCDWSYFIGSFDRYCGAYRNDIEGRKVYYLEPGSETEVLLYDFDLKLNDTLPPTYIFNPSYFNGISYVSQVDSILLGQEYHRRFAIGYHGTFSWPLYAYLIEGIGSTQGLLSQMYASYICSNLLCFKQDGLTVYPDTNYQCDIVSVESRETRNIQFHIFPNPISESAEVSFNSGIKNVEIAIFDILGVERKRIAELNNMDIINLSNLIPGIYLYQVFHSNHIVANGKIIKTQ